MTKRIGPIQEQQPDGSINYREHTCTSSGVCIQVTPQGMSVHECPFLEVRQAWADTEFWCNDNEC